MAHNDSNGSVGAAGYQPAVCQNSFVPFDHHCVPNERDLVMAIMDADADGRMMDYFDQTFLKNWV